MFKSQMPFYILKDDKVTETHDIHEWAKFIEDPKNKIIARTIIGDHFVSTVFLGIDHNFYGGPKPVLFETMVFESREETFELMGRKFTNHPAREECTQRYCTLDEAKKGHDKIVKKLKGTLKIVRAEA